MHQDATLDGRMESVLALVVLLAASSHGKCVCGGGHVYRDSVCANLILFLGV